MSETKYLNPTDVAAPAGPYHHAAAIEGWLYLAGQIPLDPDNPAAPLRQGIEAQTELVFRNIGAILRSAGYSFADVVQVRNYLLDLQNDMSGFNSVYKRQFEPGRLPPRTTVGVAALAKGARVEVDLVAYRRP